MQFLDDTEGDFPRIPKVASIKMRFYDVTVDSNAGYPPTSEDIVRIATWGKNALDTGGKLMCHCYAGRSRSAAAALLALAGHHGEAKMPEVISAFFDKYPAATPNTLMMQTGLNHFNYDSKWAGIIAKQRPAIGRW